MTTPDAIDRLAAARPSIARNTIEVMSVGDREELHALIVNSPIHPLKAPMRSTLRRRPTMAVVLIVVLLIVVGIVYGPRSSRTQDGSERSGSGTPTSTVARGTTSTASFLWKAKPSSVQFDSIAPLDGRLVASGSIHGQCFGSVADCRGAHQASDDEYIEPVVWSSSDDGYRWTQAWNPGRSLTRDTASFSQLVTAPDGSLLLFDSGTAGTLLLRSTHPGTWISQALPPAMAALGLRNLTDTGTQIVASMVDHAGELTNFTSLDGTMWRPGSPSDVPIQLESDGLGVVSFGATPEQVQTALSPLLQSPTGTPESGCDARQFKEIEWNDLIVEFNEGFFTGYRYVLGGQAAIGKLVQSTGPPNPVITTSTDIGLGSTLAQLDQAYPGIPQFGSFTLTSDRMHFVFDPSRSLSPQSKITEIKTGTCGDF